MKRMTLWHYFLHIMGWNTGEVETWWELEKLMVGFRCNCGRISGIHESCTEKQRVKL